MSNGPSTALVSLAILKVNWDNNRDYLDIFVPIVAEAIRLADDEVVVTSRLQEDIRQRFGLIIPQNTLKSMLSRVKKRGYIRLENKIYYRNQDQLRLLENSFYDVQQKVLRAYEDLAKELIEFCGKTFAINVTASDADTFFHDYLQDNAIMLSGKNGYSIIPPVLSRHSRSGKFYVGSFIQHLEETTSAHFASWEMIVIGNMLANSVFLPDVSQPDRRFKRTSVYFDTSFLIYALGYAGEVRKSPCVELLQLLYEVGAELKCFRHTLDEIRGVLSACAHKIRQGQTRTAYGPSIEYFLINGYRASDIELFAVRIDKDLEALRIQVVDKPDYSGQAYVIDEKGFQDTLLSRITYRNPDGPAVERDVDSIAAIVRLRRGRTTEVLEECGAIFVTNNAELANVARQFTYTDDYPAAIAPCITDYALTNVLWLKKPTAVPTLPRKRIIADYYAAMQPNEYLLKQYYSEVEKLSQNKAINSNDYYLLRYSLEAKYGLMAATQGGEGAITEMTVREVLDYVQNQIKAEDRLRLEQQVRETELYQNEATTLKAAEQERVSRIKVRSQQWARNATKILLVLVVILFGIGTASTFPWSLPPVESELLRYSVSVLQFVFFIASIINLIWGTPMTAYLRRLEMFLATRIEQIIHQTSS